MIGPSAARARTEPGWTFHEFACGHGVQREAPRELAAVLLAAVEHPPAGSGRDAPCTGLTPRSVATTVGRGRHIGRIGRPAQRGDDR